MNGRDLVAVAAADRVHGAREVALQAADGFAQLAAEHPEPANFAPVFLHAARVLVTNQTVMGPVWRLVNACLLAADEAEGPEFAADAVIDAAKAFRLRTLRAAKSITHELAQIIHEGSTVVTTSASSTLEDAFCALARAGRIRTLYCTRSLPGGEGEVLAKRLRGQRVRAALIEDANLTHAVEAADFVIFGADAICGDCIVNKVGTRPLALVGQATGLRATVVAETSKLVPPQFADAIRGHMATDPTLARFECVPWRELDGWLSEDGLVRAASVDTLAGSVALHMRLADLAHDLVESLRVKTGETDPGARVDPDTMARAHAAADVEPLAGLLRGDLEGGL